MAEKLDDLENRSRSKNLRILGLPESVKPADVYKLCKDDIPKALGIDKECLVERAHRLGAPQ